MSEYIKIRAIVKEAPASSRGLPTFRIPIRIEDVDFSHAPRCEFLKKDIIEKLNETCYNEGILPIYKGDKINIYLGAHGRSLGPNPYIADMIELLDDEANIKAKYKHNDIVLER